MHSYNASHNHVKWKWKWRDMWPSMVTHIRNLCSAVNPSKVHTQSSEHTQAVGSHLCCGARGAVGGSVPCSRVSAQSWYWGWRERWLFTAPTYNSCRTWDSNPQPLDYESDSLSIRPLLVLQLYLIKRTLLFFSFGWTNNFCLDGTTATLIMSLFVSLFLGITQASVWI